MVGCRRKLRGNCQRQKSGYPTLKNEPINQYNKYHLHTSRNQKWALFEEKLNAVTGVIFDPMFKQEKTI